MKTRIKRYIRHTMLIVVVLSVLVWLNRFYPVLTGTFEPDMNDPLDILLLHSNPWAELVATLGVNVFIIAPIIGTLLALVASVFSQPVEEGLTPHEGQRRRSAWGMIAFVVILVSFTGSCYMFSRPPSTDVATATSVPSVIAVPTLSLADQWQELSNEGLKLVYPATWELVMNEDGGVALGGDDFFFGFYWFDTESSTSFFFDSEGKPKEISAQAKEAIKQDAMTSVEGLEGSIIESRFFDRATIGDFKLIGAVAYEAKVEGYKLFEEPISIHIHLPYFACGEYRGCRLIYAKSGDAGMSADEWQVIERIVRSVEFSDEAIVRATIEAGPLADFREFSNNSVSFFIPKEWAIERSTITGVTLSGINEIFNFEWKQTDYKTSTIFGVEFRGNSKQRMIEKMADEVLAMLEARGGTVTSIEPIEKEVIGKYKVLVDTAFAVTVELEKAEGEIASFAMIPSAACGSQRVCTFMYGHIGTNQLSDEDWERLEQIVSTVVFDIGDSE